MMDASLATRKRETPLHAYTVLLVSVVFFSFSPIFARWADAPGLVVAAWRTVIATGVLLVPTARQAPTLKRLDRSAWAWAILGGLLFATTLSLFHIALDTASAANVTFIDNIAPLWVGLLMRFLLRRGLPSLFWPGVMVALLGASLIIVVDAVLDAVQPGDLIALVESVTWAVYLLVSERVRAHFSAVVYAWLAVAISATLLLPLSLLNGYALTGYTTQTTIAFLGAGLLSQVSGFWGLNYAMGHLPPSRITVTILLQPVITALAALILLGEAFGGWRLVGGGLILVGVYLVNRSRASTDEP